MNPYRFPPKSSSQTLNDDDWGVTIVFHHLPNGAPRVERVPGTWDRPENAARRAGGTFCIHILGKSPK